MRKSLYYLFYKYIPCTALYSYDQVSAQVQNMHIQTDSLIFIRLLDYKSCEHTGNDRQDNWNMWMVFTMHISMPQVTFLEAGPTVLRCDGTRSWVASQRPHTVAVAPPNLTAPYSTCLDAHVPQCAYVPPSKSHKTVLGYKK